MPFLRPLTPTSTCLGDNQLEQYDAAAESPSRPWEVRVQAFTPLAGPGHGQVAIRVGRLLMYINDREALDSFLDAWQQAAGPR